MQDSIVVRPRLHGGLADDDLFEKILRVLQRPNLRLHFGWVVHIQRRLNIVFLVAKCCYKINF